MLSLPAFAKINLSLELLGRRADGYWEIRTVYQTVSLHDRLHLRLTRRGGVEIRVPHGGAPSGRANLAAKILERARRQLGLKQGIEVEIEKNIPMARGLGGGSSDAAAALVGLLRLAREQLPEEALRRLAAAAGSDVPFFLLGGRALGVGRGEEVYPLDDLPARYCVLLCPPWPISTRAAYNWARQLTPPRRAAKIMGAGSLQDGLWSSGNDFEPVVFPRFPDLARMKAALLRAGAEQAGLSGSGSTVYGLFADRASAEAAAARWAGAAAAFVAVTLPRSAYRRSLGAERWGVVQR
ncbi:MAG TPA: 4-(cytidine 5'-diphospho)-2-C-methyl-D-erythritol kinase [Candidatus Xenobia bacterium]|nr:4-(cytidine 5'-diphospho)-2-C-methyl-D-erythritol kinase [Candidatus Xenobia bacterium]